MGTATFSVEQRGQKKGEKKGQAPICVGIISFFFLLEKVSCPLFLLSALFLPFYFWICQDNLSVEN